MNELLGDHLESSEWLLLPGNLGDHLRNVVKTIIELPGSPRCSRGGISDKNEKYTCADFGK